MTHPWLFFALTYGWSWLFWIPAALSGLSLDEPPTSILLAVGGVGPMVVAIALTFLTQNKDGWRDYGRRIVDLRRVSAGWYAVTLLTVPALTALAVSFDVLFGGHGAHLEARFQARLTSILSFAVFTLFFGPFPEELGWRGYALDRLQCRHGAVVSSLILGIVWTAWHIPLFFIRGSYQYGLGWGTAAFWWFVCDKTFQSILMTWIYNHNRRSIAAAVLFHFMVNFVGELFVLTERAELYQIVVWAAAAIAVVAIWGPKTLTRSSTQGESTWHTQTERISK